MLALLPEAEKLITMENVTIFAKYLSLIDNFSLVCRLFMNQLDLQQGLVTGYGARVSYCMFAS